MSGKRYSEKEKSKIVDFVNSWDKEHGRGGKLQAVKKFKVAPLTLRTWVENESSNGNAAASKAQPSKTSGKQPAPKAQSFAQGTIKGSLMNHIDNIESYSNQISELKSKIEMEKETINNLIQ